MNDRNTASPAEFVEQRVKIYRNLSNGFYSVVGSDGRIVCYIRPTDPPISLGNVKFVVRPAGRRRVLEEKRRCVHAFIEGTLTMARKAPTEDDPEVTYNPYQSDKFRIKGLGPRRELGYEGCVTIHQGRIHIVKTFLQENF